MADIPPVKALSADDGVALASMYGHPIIGTFNACRTLSPREVEELERMSIPADALAGPFPVVSSNVYFDGDRFVFAHHRHRYDEESVHAFLFLITNQWDEAVDIVAWSPVSGQLATWLGRAWALGEETIYDPRLDEHGALLRRAAGASNACWLVESATERHLHHPP